MPSSKTNRSGKLCPNCGSAGPFTVKKSGKLASWCKECTKQKTAEYCTTPRGHAVRAWNNILYRCGRHPAYLKVQILLTRQQFLDWAEPHYRKWLLKNPGVSPSIDRIRSSEHYELGNLRIVSRGDNTRNRIANRNVKAPNGKVWCSTCQAYRSTKEFSKNRCTWNGLEQNCKTHHAQRLRARRLKR